MNTIIKITLIISILALLFVKVYVPLMYYEGKEKQTIRSKHDQLEESLSGLNKNSKINYC